MRQAILTSLFFSLILITSTFAFEAGNIDGCPYFFSKPIKIGSNSLDVKILQKILNSDPRTQVAVSGPGSRGMETFIFGNATKLALKKFQALYQDIIPNQDGTINIDTAKVLNSLCRESIEATKAPKVATNTVPVVITPLTVKLSSDNPYLSKKIRIYLDTNNVIVKPTPDSVICDNCTVYDIRKLASKRYLVTIIPNEGVGNAGIQIEAGKLNDINKNTNEDASNHLIFATNPASILNELNKITP